VRETLAIILAPFQGAIVAEPRSGGLRSASTTGYYLRALRAEAFRAFSAENWELFSQNAISDFISTCTDARLPGFLLRCTFNHSLDTEKNY
jgi:hypothetical protein